MNTTENTTDYSGSATMGDSTMTYDAEPNGSQDNFDLIGESPNLIRSDPAIVTAVSGRADVESSTLTGLGWGVGIVGLLAVGAILLGVLNALGVYPTPLNDDQIHMKIQSAPAMTINSKRNIIMRAASDPTQGSTNPADHYALTVVTDPGESKPRLLKLVNQGTAGLWSGASIALCQDAGAPLIAGNRIGYINFVGASDTVHNTQTGASIEAYATETWSSDKGGGQLIFRTTGVERMRLNDRGILDVMRGGFESDGTVVPPREPKLIMVDAALSTNGQITTSDNRNDNHQTVAVFSSSRSEKGSKILVAGHRGDGGTVECSACHGYHDAPTPILNTNRLGGILARGYYQRTSSIPGYSENVAAITMHAAANFTAASNPTYIDFATTAGGKLQREVRMRISPDGQTTLYNDGGCVLSLKGRTHAFMEFRKPVDAANSNMDGQASRLGYIGYKTAGDATAGLLTIANESSTLGLAFGPGFNGLYGLYPSTGSYTISLGMNADNYRIGNLFITNSPTVASDRNLKNSIHPSDLGLYFIEQLKPVQYRMNKSTTETASVAPVVSQRGPSETKTERLATPPAQGRIHYGLLAQDVKATLDQLGKTPMDFAGWCSDVVDGVENQGLRYTEFIAPLIRAVQELKAQVDAQAQLLQRVLTASNPTS